MSGGEGGPYRGVAGGLGSSVEVGVVDGSSTSSISISIRIRIRISISISSSSTRVLWY